MDLNIEHEVMLVMREGIYLPSYATSEAAAGDYEKARSLFDHWIHGQYEPGDYRVYYNRAICNYELEDYEKALRDVNIAIKLKFEWSKGRSSNLTATCLNVLFPSTHRTLR